jgi:hypothetical protein
LVVVGRNISLRLEDGPPAYYPVAVQNFDEFLNYGVDNLWTLVQCPVQVLAVSAPSGERGAQTTTGHLTAVEVDERRGATVVIDQQRYQLRDLFQLKLV